MRAIKGKENQMATVTMPGRPEDCAKEAEQDQII